MLRTDEFVLRPITAADAERDHAAVMDTREELRVWEQSAWPEDDFTVEANRADLDDLETRHRKHRAFTFTVLDPAEQTALGCVYLFPIDATFLAKATVTPVAGERWDDVDVVVYFWLRPALADAGADRRLLDALRRWLADEWGFATPVFVTNEQYERQLRMLRSTDLEMHFELREPEKAGAYLVFG